MVDTITFHSSQLNVNSPIGFNFPSQSPMTTYTTARKSYWPHILTQWAISSVPAFLIVFIASYFITIKEATYWIFGTLSLMQLVGLMDTPRNYKVIIDEDNRTLTQYNRRPLAGDGEKVFTLSKVRLYVITHTSSTISAADVKGLKLYKDHREALKLDIKKDGFKPETLYEISQALEKLGVPISI